MTDDISIDPGPDLAARGPRQKAHMGPQMKRVGVRTALYETFSAKSAASCCKYIRIKNRYIKTKETASFWGHRCNCGDACLPISVGKFFAR